VVSEDIVPVLLISHSVREEGEAPRDSMRRCYELPERIAAFEPGPQVDQDLVRISPLLNGRAKCRAI